MVLGIELVFKKKLEWLFCLMSSFHFSFFFILTL